MAIGFQFLAKTSSLQPKGNALNAAARNNRASQAQGRNDNKTDLPKADYAAMSTSDLIKNVYNNQAVDIHNQSGQDETKPNNVKLPLTVDYANMQFSSHGKNFEELVQEISNKTHDSTCKVESELKRKYTSVTGGSINMNA